MYSPGLTYTFSLLFHHDLICDPGHIPESHGNGGLTYIPVGPNVAVMVDCSHGNSLKQHKNQMKVAEDVAAQVSDGSRKILGVMVESFLVEGNQKCDPGVTDTSKLVYGQSITDACIDFATCEALLNKLAMAVRDRRKKTG